MQLPKRKPGKYSQLPVDNVLSEEKYKELKNELEKLKKRRPKLAGEVSRLAELGDFSENMEYQLAKRRLRGLNSAILKTEYRINHAEIIEESSDGVVRLGSVVTVRTSKGENTYTILGSSEADPSGGIISHQSPLGSALMGHRVGDVLEIDKIGKCEVIKIKSGHGDQVLQIYQ